MLEPHVWCCLMNDDSCVFTDTFTGDTASEAGRPDPRNFKYALVDNGMPIDIGVLCCTFYGLSAGFHLLSLIMGIFDSLSIYYWSQMVSHPTIPRPGSLPRRASSATLVWQDNAFCWWCALVLLASHFVDPFAASSERIVVAQALARVHWLC